MPPRTSPRSFAPAPSTIPPVMTINISPPPQLSRPSPPRGTMTPLLSQHTSPPPPSTPYPPPATPSSLAFHSPPSSPLSSFPPAPRRQPRHRVPLSRGRGSPPPTGPTPRGAGPAAGLGIPSGNAHNPTAFSFVLAVGGRGCPTPPAPIVVASREPGRLTPIPCPP
ncbi:uncharacterized protein [Prorops nasuta]|uniref:uncharacterized protein n=1 Tax=Prorops nasuta TaxID=863751 RepID=UPI0034CF1B09